jgi:hypothetical protein
MAKLEEKTVSEVLYNARLITQQPVKGSKGLKKQFLVGFDKDGHKKVIPVGMVQ